MVEESVLIIKQGRAIMELLAEVLRHDGYRVECVSTPHEALLRCSAKGPGAVAVVLTDTFASPSTDRYAWLDQLRATTHAPIVICASYPAAWYADHRERGFTAYLQEPFDMWELLALVASLCSRPAA